MLKAKKYIVLAHREGFWKVVCQALVLVLGVDTKLFDIDKDVKNGE